MLRKCEKHFFFNGCLMGDIHILSLFSNGCLKGADMGIGYFNNKLYLFHKSVFITK